MAVQIITDSIADVTGEDREKLIILPVTIRFVVIIRMVKTSLIRNSMKD